jgi:HD-GYP domain-containing protein (c-di-GMP phosphodiesterase class II)
VSQDHPETRRVSDGEELLTAMFRLLQVVKIHQANNKLFMDNVASFRQTLNKLWANGRPVECALLRGRFYLNDERIVYSAAMWNTADKIADFFQDRRISGLKFSPAQGVADESIVSLMDILNRAKREPSPYEWLVENLTGELAWVKAKKDEDQEKQEKDGRPVAAGGLGHVSPELADEARRAYSQALTVLRAAYKRLQDKRKIGLQKAKRAVQELIDVLFADEAAFLALSTIRNGTDSLFTHSVNTAVLAIGLGYRLRLNRGALEQLGLAGLFHDIGKVGAPLQVASVAGRLDGKELALAKSHVLASLFHIIQFNATFALKLAMIVPTTEHHQGLDGSGYPQNKNPQKISLFGRILAIVDQYVAMTSARPWRPEMTPFEALKVILDKATKDLDPLLVKLFVNMVGPWPVGSLLALNTRELALSKITPTNREDGYPMAMLLNVGQDGQLPTPGEIVDLGEKNSDGSLRRRVLNCFHPSQYGLQPVDYLLGPPSAAETSHSLYPS